MVYYLQNFLFFKDSYRKSSLALLFTLIGVTQALAVDYYWVGNTNGTWNSTANWSLTPGGAGGAGTPGITDRAIFDGSDISSAAGAQTGSVTVTFSAINTAVGSLEIINFSSPDKVVFTTSLTTSTFLNVWSNFTHGSGQLLQLYGGADPGAVFCLRPASNLSVFIIDGNIEATHMAGPTSGYGRLSAFRAGNQGVIDFRNGSSYTHNVNGDSIPTAIYNIGSTVVVSGISDATAFAHWGATTFGNFVWDCTGQSSNFAIDRDLTVSSLDIIGTDIGTLDLALTAPRQLTVTGDATVAGGLFRLSSGTNPGRLRVEGDFIQTGGTLDLLSGSQLQLLNDLNQSGSTSVITASAGNGQIAFIGIADADFVAESIFGNVAVLIEKNTPTAEVEYSSFQLNTIASLNIKSGLLSFSTTFPQELRVSGLLQLNADGILDMRGEDHILRLDGAVVGLTDANLLVTTSGTGENSIISFGSNLLQTIPALSIYRRLEVSGGLKLLAGNVTTNSLFLYGGSIRLNSNNLIVAGGTVEYPEGGFVQTNGSGRWGVFFNVAEPIKDLRMATIAGSSVTVSMGDVATEGIYYFRVMEPAAVGTFPPALISDYANFEMELQAPTGAGTVPINYFTVSYPSALNIGTPALQRLYVFNGVWQPYPSALFGSFDIFLEANNFTISETLRKYAIFRTEGLVVNSTADTPDANPGDGICDDGTGNCTLRAAIEEANALPGFDLIRFNIAGAGPHTILLTSDLPDITEQVLIDGYSQPGAVPNTNAIGLPNNAVIKIEINRVGAAVSNGLRLAAANIEVKGLSITNQSGAAITVSGLDVADCKVTGCFIGIRPDNTFLPNGGNGGIVISGFINNTTIGDGTPAGMNVIEIDEFGIGVLIEDAYNNRIIGNYIGTDATGTNSFSNSGVGVQIIGDYSLDNSIGNGNAAQRNVIAGLNEGVLIQGSGTGNAVKGNYIGTNATGNAAISTDVGISIAYAGDLFIGRSSETEAGNLISGLNGPAINLGPDATGVYIWGNAIGVAANLTNPLGNSGAAVLIDDNSSNNQIGGSDAWQGNIIAHNSAGIVIGNSGPNTGNRILHNRIYNNTGPGILLDAGANNDKAAPTINTITPTDLALSGTGNDGDLIQIFTNNGFASPNTAEGRLLIGEAFVSGGTWTIPFAPVPGHRYTATATDVWGNTSPFSVPQTLTSGIFVVNTTANTPDSNPGDGICDDGTGNCSLLAAAEESNASLGVNAIYFNIPGAGPHIINGSFNFSDRVVVNGYTQPGATPATSLVSPANIQIEIQGTLQFNSQTTPFTSSANYSELLGIAIAGGALGEISIAPGISNVSVRGNYIGRRADATLVAGPSPVRMTVQGNNNTIGGRHIADRNLIGGSISLQGSNNVVQGNFIAVRPDATDIDVIPSMNAGIIINGSNNIIGGAELEMPNRIGGAQVGIRVQAGTGNNFRNNRIYCNEQAAAELVSGANNDKSAPNVQFFGNDGGNNPFLQLEGNAVPFDTVTVYRDNSIACAFTTAPRQARDIIATTIANSEGFWSISLSGVSLGDRLSVSATDGGGNTSPFVQLPAFRLTSTNIPAQRVPSGTLQHVLTQFALENITQGPASLSDFAEVIVPFRGTYTNADISQFQFYENTSNDISTATLVYSAFATAAGEDITFSAPVPITINPGDTRYFWITTDIAPLANNGETVFVGAMRKGRFLFNGGTSIIGVDSLPAQGVQTICSLPTPTVIITLVPVVGGTAELLATATGVTNFRWYDVPTGGSPLATTSGLFTTPPVIVTTTFYVSSYDPLSGCESSREAVTVTPAIQATVVKATNITPNSAELNWTNGNGTHRLAIITDDISPIVPPLDNTSYSANTVYSGSGNQVVFNGSGTGPVTVTGLLPAARYTLQVFEYNENPPTIRYNTTSGFSNPIDFYTLATEPTSQPTPLTITNITATSAVGNVVSTPYCTCSGYVATVRPLGTPEAPPQDGQVYTVGSLIAPNVRVVYRGNLNTFFLNNLLPDTEYVVSVYSLNGTGATTNYLISPSLSATFRTAAKVPDASPTALTFSGITDRKIEGAFTPSFGGATGYLVIRRPQGSTRVLPQDGRDYAVGTTLAPDHWVVAQGNAVSFIADGLQAATTYTFDVYAYNGNGARRLYRTTDPLSGDATTLATQPAAPPTNLRFTQRTKSSLGGEFTESLPAPENYLITIRLPDTPPFVPEDGKAYNVGEIINGVRIIGINNTRQFSAAQLEADTQYAVDVYAFNGQDKTANYLSDALTGVGRTLPFTPILQSISPTFTIAEGAATELTLLGDDFLPGAVVRWNGSIRLATTFVNSRQLKAVIPPELIANVGTEQISVANSADAVPAPELVSENRAFEIRAGVNIGVAGVAAGNVDPNTDKHPLYAVGIFARGQEQVLQSLQLRTEGTFTAQDLKANSIRLWLSSNPSYDPQDRELAAIPAVDAGNTLTFNNLNLGLQRSTNVFLIVTADIAVQAQAGHTLRIGATSHEQFVLANNQIAKIGLNPLPAGGTQTINSAQVNNPMDIERLRRLYNATGGNGWREKWNFNDPPGTWYGVKVEDGEVVSIDLSDNNLSGDLAAVFEANIVAFNKLRYLNLSNNRLSGNFPQWVLNLGELEYLDISRNDFSGAIPDGISRLRQLVTLILSYNRFDRLTEQIGALANLEVLLMDNNQFTALPNALYLLQKLRILIVRNNNLTMLPNIFASLQQLRYLDVSFNRLAALPTSISRLTLLEAFLFHNNEISDLPPMDALRRLQKLYAYSNKLEFDDLLPLMPQFRPIDFVYAPQARIGTPQTIYAEQGSSFTLEIRTGGAHNRYRWLRNGRQVALTDSPLLPINSATAAQSGGIYTVEVTNAEAPALTLLSTEYDVRLSCGSSTTGINTSLTVSGGLNFCEGEAIFVQLSAPRNQNVVELLWLKDGQGIGGAASLNFTAREPGTYTVRMLTEGGCTVLSESITIRRNPIPVVRVRTENGRMTAETTGEVVSYQWFKNNVQIADANRAQFEPSESGFYRVRITDRNGCTSFSEPEEFNVTALPAEPVWADDLRVYPNPSMNGIFQVKFPIAMLRQSKDVHTLRITDLQGRQVLVHQLTTNDLLFDTQLNLEAQPSGVYLLHIETPEGLIVRKLVKK
jgi:CSLREA domain-containing protein